MAELDDLPMRQPGLYALVSEDPIHEDIDVYGPFVGLSEALAAADKLKARAESLVRYPPPSFTVAKMLAPPGDQT
jgi:hypothetical protein